MIYSFIAALILTLTGTALAAGLNDTGITDCWDDTGVVTTGVEADSGTHPRQDCRYGRDAAAKAGKLTKVGGGSKGFDFTKIANNGTVLPRSATLGSAASDWACTRDNVTGLLWEVKTTSGLRSQDHTYTWYNSDSASNGGNVGTATGGACATTGRCDTEKFVADVNAVGLCGATDWRMPAVNELESILDRGISLPGPTLDTTYFPNTQASIFRSASTYAGDSGGQPRNVVFGSGYSLGYFLSYAYRVRLVRAGQ